MFCYCGNGYGRHGMSEDCNVACLGDDNQMCGGFSSNDVYHVNGERYNHGLIKLAVGEQNQGQIKPPGGEK